MHFPRRDLLATGLVAVAGLIYVLWTLDIVSNVHVAGIAMLVCGFAASTSTVVPGFDDLLHGNRAYLVVTSFIGAAALVGGAAVMVRHERGCTQPRSGRDGCLVGDRDGPSRAARRALTRSRDAS